jgi:hypothetical protein
MLFGAQPALTQQGPVGVFADTAVRDLIGARVMASDGRNIGEVERVVQHDGNVLAVVGVGGFLGFGEHDVALPIGDFAQEELGLSLAAYTEDDLRALVPWSGEGEVMPLNVTVAGQPVPDLLTPVPPEAPTTQ